MNARVSIDCSRLDTEAGVCEAAVTMAAVVSRDVLFPVLDHTPEEQRQAIFERFLSGIVGVLCAYVGPDRAKETLDAVKLAISEVQAEREAQRRHAH